MDHVLVDSTVMRNISAEMNAGGTTISDLVSVMMADANAMEGIWRGQAGETYVQQFFQLSDTFAEKTETIAAYAEFLSKSADGWDATHGTIAGQAGSLPIK